jgi:hypothetical protein
MTPEEQQQQDAAAKHTARLEQLAKATEFLEASVGREHISRRGYHRGQVMLAHDYLVELQEVNLGTQALRRCNPKYFLEDDQQRQDMAEDPKYASLVVALARAMVDAGLVDVIPVPAATQLLGEA